MSFRCDYCGKAQPSGTKPTIQTPADSWRKKIYEHYDAETEVMIRVEGREPMAEFKTCRDCMSLGPEAKPAEPDMRTFLLQTSGYHNHARSCKGFRTVKGHDLSGEETKEQIPCRVCELVMRDFAAYPAQVLSRCLEDPLKAHLKTPIYLLIRDKMIDRVSDSENVFLSKRAFNDGAVAISLLKRFSTDNPKLLRG